MTKILGITGLIGSGKTTVAHLLQAQGLPIYYSDQRAKELMLLPELRAAIIARFSEQAYLPNGELNRKFLATKAFFNRLLRADLEAIVHPAVLADFAQWVDRRPDEQWVGVESAILIESGLAATACGVLVVNAPRELRMARVIKRDRLDAQAVEMRMNAQMDQVELNKYATWSLMNDTNGDIGTKVAEFHEKLFNFASY